MSGSHQYRPHNINRKSINLISKILGYMTPVCFVGLHSCTITQLIGSLTYHLCPLQTRSLLFEMQSELSRLIEQLVRCTNRLPTRRGELEYLREQVHRPIKLSNSWSHCYLTSCPQTTSLQQHFPELFARLHKLL